MQNRNTLYIVIAIIVVALAVLGSYWLDHRTVAPTVGTATTTAESATTTTKLVNATSSTGSAVGSIVTSGDGSYTVKLIPEKTAAKAPDYTKPLVFSASITPAVKTVLQSQFTTTVAGLNKDKYDFNMWVNLGSVRHMAGDEQGAKEIWEYVSLVWPSNAASFNSLGDLYANFLKDYAKAESNYLIAIKNKPADTNPYKNLFTLYYNAGYNKNKAEGILKQGIAAVPKAVDMQVLLARYYRDNGRTVEAKAEYSLAISNAQSQGQTDLATTLQTELSTI